eukprot:Nitzschia sp. Nitz4//scaffold27_size158506//73997//75382//NITZ4_002600-RA/size158506-processed-gene-0.78-mRNA-1//-1//CDS//3329545488//8680//frame0
MRVPLANIVPPQELDEQFIPPRSIHLVSTPPPITYETTSPPRLHSMSREVSDSSQGTNYTCPPSFEYNETPSRIGSFAESMEGISHVVNHPDFLADIIREPETKNKSRAPILNHNPYSSSPSYHQPSYCHYKCQQGWAESERRNYRNLGFVPIKHPQSWVAATNNNQPTHPHEEIKVSIKQETPITPRRKPSKPTLNSSPDKTRETPTQPSEPTPSDQPLVPPRRPRSAYVLFFKSVRDNNLAQVRKRREKMMNMETLIPTVERLWKSMPEEERQSFQDQAKKEADDYEVAMERYKEQQEPQKQRAEKEGEPNNVAKRPSTELPPKESPHKKARRAPKKQHDKVAGVHSPSGSTASTVPESPCTPNGNDFLTPPHHTWNAAAEQITRLQEGTEVYLNQGGRVRRYRVEYKCFRMERSQLDDFLKSPSGTGGWPVSQPVWVTPSSTCHDSCHLGDEERSFMG